MIVEVEVKRAEQSWDLTTRRQQNYLVIEVFGVETRVPCSEEQLFEAISTLSEKEDFEEPDEVSVREAPSTFVAEVSAPEPVRSLAPVTRRRGDDVGIAQG